MALVATISGTTITLSGFANAAAVVASGVRAGIAYAGNQSAVIVNVDKILVPGDGWEGATEQPADIGNPTANGYTQSESAIARWDVVPYQTFADTLNVGVVAEHSSGISMVSFSVNGGEWLDVTAATGNINTANTTGIGVASDVTGVGIYSNGIVEYWATLRAEDFADGEVEVRAIVYPLIGTPRVLQGSVDSGNGVVSLFLLANSGGTYTGTDLYVKPSTGSDSNPGTAISPLATLARALRNCSSGDTIYLTEAGTYNPNNTYDVLVATDTFVTIQAGEGLSRNDVIIGPPTVSSIRTWVQKTRWRNVTVDWKKYVYFTNDYTGMHMLWFDGVRFIGVATSGDYDTAEGQVHADSKWWVTNSKYDHVRAGIADCEMVRNVTMEGNRGDIFDNGKLVLNIDVSEFYVDSDYIGVEHDIHGDLNQFWGDHANVLYWGIHVADARNVQLIFLNEDGTMTDGAFVDIIIDSYDPRYASGSVSASLGQIFGNCNNVYMKNFIDPQDVIFRTDFTASGMKFVGRDVIFEGCRMNWRNEATHDQTIPDGVTFVDCEAYT